MNTPDKQINVASQEKSRDELLLRLLNTPPQPRPKRDRGKPKSANKAEKQGGSRRQVHTEAE